MCVDQRAVSAARRGRSTPAPQHSTSQRGRSTWEPQHSSRVRGRGLGLKLAGGVRDAGTAWHSVAQRAFCMHSKAAASTLVGCTSHSGTSAC